MMAPTPLRGIHWMMVAVLALAPGAAFAQQDTPSPQPEAAQGKTQETQKPPAASQAKTDVQEQSEGAPDQPAPTDKDQKDPKVISGMSILGNQDAPKALVIVPWKSSELGKSLSISTMLDDSRQPIDKEVFMRVLSYYEVRTKSNDVAPAANTAPAAAAAQGRK